MPILLSPGPGQPTNPQHMFLALGSPSSDLLCTSALLHLLILFPHSQTETEEGTRKKEKEKHGVTPQRTSNQATESTFMSVSMCELVQMFLCIMSFCAFCGCHPSYSYSGRSRCGGGVGVCYCTRLHVCYWASVFVRTIRVLDVESGDILKSDTSDQLPDFTFSFTSRKRWLAQ